MITPLKFVGIPTRNHAAALAFYTEKLGFKVVTDQPLGPARRWACSPRSSRPATRSG